MDGREALRVLYCEACGALLPGSSRFCVICGQESARTDATPSGGNERPQRSVDGPAAPVRPEQAGGTWGLERFTLSGRLGQGASGTVYLAHDAVSSTDVALKLLDPALAESPGYLRRFFAEVESLRHLSHENVARIVDFGRDGSRAWLGPEYVPGASLRQLLDRFQPLAPAQALGVLAGALAGLAHVHEAGIVHGDITTNNLLVDPNGKSKLTDFGSAVGPSGRGVGVTPAYASPEAAQGLPMDARSDLYSMGVVLYECLAGRRPFSGSSDEVVLHRHVTADVPPIEGLAPPVHELLAASLAKDPEQRPQSAADFLVRLDVAAELAEGPTWRERTSVAALAAVAGGELGSLIAPAVLAPVAGVPRGLASRAHPPGLDAQPGGVASVAPQPAVGSVTSSPLTPPPPVARALETIGNHKLAAAAIAATLAAGVITPIVLAAPNGASPSTTSTSVTSGQTSNRSDQTTVPAQNGQAATPPGTSLPPGQIADPSGGSWSVPSPIDPNGALEAISCASASFCFAVDGEGNYLIYDGSTWSSPSPLDPQAVAADSLIDTVTAQSVSCPAEGYCVVVEEGGQSALFDEGGNALVYDHGSWTGTPVDQAQTLTSVSCATTSFCAAVDTSGNVLTFDGVGWSAPERVEPGSGSPGGSVSCPTTSFCMAVDDEGNWSQYTGGLWTAPQPVDDTGDDLDLNSVSCPTSNFCVALDGDQAYLYDGATWSGPTSTTSSDLGGGPVIVTCASPSFCKVAFPSIGTVAYDGKGWSRGGPVEGYPSQYVFASLSCPSPDFCMGVGGEYAQRFYGPS